MFGVSFGAGFALHARKMKTGIFVLGMVGVLSFAQGEPVAGGSAHHHALSIARDEARIRAGISDQEPWVGLIGDSGITGAATSLDLDPNFWSLGKLIANFLGESRRTVQIADPARVPGLADFGIADQERLSPLVRVVYSQAEFQEAVKDGRRYEKNLEAKGNLRLDIPEYSFGYLLARGLGVPAERIVLTAQDGRRVGAILEQAERLREVSPSMPSLLLISFTANDLCGDELQGSLEAFRAQFRAEVHRQLHGLISGYRPHPKLGTRVVITAPLDVPQILTNENLLAQEVDFQGRGRIACGEIRENRAAITSLGAKMQETLVSMCRSIVPTSRHNVATIQKIRAFQNEQIEVWREVVAQLPETSGWSFEVRDENRAPRFAKGDLANDCFHPGPGAHAKIARELLRALK